MQTRWSLVVADFRREYQVTVDALAAMDYREFQWLLSGLSSRSRFRAAWDKQPKHMHDPNERAALIAAARR